MNWRSLLARFLGGSHRPPRGGARGHGHGPASHQPGVKTRPSQPDPLSGGHGHGRSHSPRRSPKGDLLHSVIRYLRGR